jgi:hypothetical protein
LAPAAGSARPGAGVSRSSAVGGADPAGSARLLLSESLKSHGLSGKSFLAIRLVLNQIGRRKRKKMIYIKKRIEQKRQNKISRFPSLAFNQFHFGADIHQD